MAQSEVQPATVRKMLEWPSAVVSGLSPIVARRHELGSASGPPVRCGCRVRGMLIAVVALSQVAALAAAEEKVGISVIGAGQVSAMPNVVEFRVRVAGASELSGDAMVKFRDAKRRTLAAIEQLKLKNLHVAVGGVSVALAGGPQQEHLLDFSGEAARPPLQQQTEFACGLRLSLHGIQDVPEDKLIAMVSQVVDKLHDSGVPVLPAADDVAVAQSDEESDSGQQKIATFYVEDVGALREKAYRQAFAAARSNAEKLAKLAGVRLGPVLSLQEISQLSADDQSLQASMSDGVGRERNEPDKPRIGSHTFAAIQVRVGLQVRFGIEKQ